MFEGLILTLLAEEQKPQGGLFQNPLTLFLMIGVVWVFLVILPGRKEKKRKAEMLDNLKKGDKVLTQAGIIGKVHSADAEKVVLDFGGTKIPVLKSTVIQILGKKEGNGNS